MRNIEHMKGKMFQLIDDVRAMVEAAETEQRALSSEEQEKKEKIMADIRQLEKDIAEEEEIQRIESQRANHPDNDPEKTQAEWRSLGEFAYTVINNPRDERLQRREVGSQTMGEGSEGGYLVPTQFSDQILTVSPDEAVIRPRANVFTGGEADFKIPALKYSDNNMYAGASVTWIDEGDVKPQTDVEFKQITLQPYEIAAHVEVTDKLLRNANMVEQVVRNQLRGALIDAEEDAFLTGNGVGKPRGVIGSDPAIGVTREDDNKVQYDDLVNMFARFRGRRGVWIANRGVLPQLMTEVKDGDGRILWQPNARDGQPGSIFGLPVVMSDHSPDMNQTGSLVLADLSYYLIKDGVGVAIAASPHMKFTNNITIIKAFKTVDGKPWLSGPLPTSYETSPFVQLENA